MVKVGAVRPCNTFLGFLLILPSIVVAAPELRFTFGTLRGVDTQTLGTGNLYYSYFSIPFAAPPVGNLRFKPPVPFAGAGGPDRVINSDDFPNACLQQPVPTEGGMSEDCLYLNVFTPTSASSQGVLKKVMLFVHGGRFEVGMTRRYVPGRLVTDHDVIVVSAQYRLNVLGFLSSGDDVLPGNLGIQDLILALRWVKDNIRQFGGDPDDVMIFGNSAGSILVSHLALLPQARGLFTKVALLSGTAAAASFAVKDDPESTFYEVAEALGCLPRFYFPGARSAYHRNIVNCLARKNATEINAPRRTNPAVQSFAPVVDGDIIPRNPKAVLQDDLYMRRHGVLDRSYVIGFTNAEGLLLVDQIGFISADFLKRLTQPSNIAAYIQSSVKGFSLPPTQDVLNVVDFVYTFPREADGSIPFQKYVEVASDAPFVVSSVQFARTLAEKTAVYLHLFDHNPAVKNPALPLQGTSHAMDMYYLFDFSPEFSQYFSSYANLYTPESEPVPIAYRGVLASFAKDGSPRYQTNPAALISANFGSTSEENWSKYDMSQQQYLAISATPEMRREVYAQRIALWTDFLPRLAAKSSYFGRSGRAAYD